jgi:hypothetical protein
VFSSYNVLNGAMLADTPYPFEELDEWLRGDCGRSAGRSGNASARSDAS